MIMAIIPFGVAGAIWGHLLFGLPLSMFSLFGLVALTGVVVNDSIVLIDFINERVRSGMDLREAIIDAGRRRFRPVLLTSVTTIAGLLPIVMETSLQAQIVIPMAVALCFGLLFSTVLVLVMVPMLYQLYSRLVGRAAPEYDEEDEPHAGQPQLAEAHA
jgi:hydrophobic/amphiphilic exporter-1 (mainly G- bacteria), HAE1 family